MKQKFFHVLICAIALMSYSICLADTTCKISGTTDTVEVLSADLSGENKVNVSIGNDSNFTAANVTVTIEVTYKHLNYTKTKTYTGKTLVQPQSSTTLVINISDNIDSKYKPDSVSVVSITGAKCQQ